MSSNELLCQDKQLIVSVLIFYTRLNAPLSSPHHPDRNAIHGTAKIYALGMDSVTQF